VQARELARRAEEAGVLDRLGDGFVLERSILHATPVGHILAGFSFETIDEARHIRVVAFATPLAPPADGLAYSMSDVAWQGDVREPKGLPGELLAALVDRVPLVARHSDPRRFLRSRRRTRNHDAVDEEEAYLHLAAGNLRRARWYLRHLSRGRSPWPWVQSAARVFDDVPPISPATRERATRMLELLDDGEASALAELRAWQDETLAAVRLSRGGEAFRTA
jgi:hypothetical protein